MKNLKSYIQEAFRINQSNKPEQIEHKYFPKDRDELKGILKKRLLKDENADLNDIDVSNVTDMNYLFDYLDPHNIDISEWDVSNVVDMSYMFYFCDKFDSDLSYWDVSNVKQMQYMFGTCKKFKGEGLDNWDVSNVKNMHNMFYECNSLKMKPSWYKN